MPRPAGRGHCRAIDRLPANCSDVDGDALTYTLDTMPPGATGTINGAGRITFTAGQPGTFTFGYRASDATAASPVVLATVDVAASSARTLIITTSAITGNRGGGGAVAFGGRVDGGLTTCPTLSLSLDAHHVARIPTFRAPLTTKCVGTNEAGTMAIDLRDGTVTGLLSLPRAFSVTSNTIRFTLDVQLSALRRPRFADGESGSSGRRPEEPARARFGRASDGPPPGQSPARRAGQVGCLKRQRV